MSTESKTSETSTPDYSNTCHARWYSSRGMLYCADPKGHVEEGHNPKFDKRRERYEVALMVSKM